MSDGTKVHIAIVPASEQPTVTKPGVWEVSIEGKLEQEFASLEEARAWAKAFGTDMRASEGSIAVVVCQAEPIMQFFECAHLPAHLQEVSKLFCVLANLLHTTLPRNAERSVALRKLLEGKDAAVRARLVK